MSYNAPSWITTYVSRENSRTNPPSSGDDGFRIALNGAEAVDSHDAETISYIIIEEGYSELSAIKYDAKQAILLEASATLRHTTQPFRRALTAPPLFWFRHNWRWMAGTEAG